MKDEQKIENLILLESDVEIVEQIASRTEIAISHWKVGRNKVEYEKKDSHTISLYLNGGESSFRIDQPFNKGGAGKLVLMPQEHRSEWSINGEIEFLHLYFSDNVLKQFASISFDCDVRTIELKDIIYSTDLRLRALLFEYCFSLKHSDNISHLLSEQTLNDILYHIIKMYSSFGVKNYKIKGGLSINHLHRTKSIIIDCLEEKLTIGRLADEVGLSQFHFAKMFKLSFGEAPASFILRMRIEKVKQLLKTNSSLADISAVTGFSHQSHMSQYFKNMVGVTPLVYRKL